MANKKCQDCGYDNWIALQFDHIDPTQKSGEVPVMVNEGKSLTKVQIEISKCEIVCANCHTIRTAKQFGSWRLHGWQEHTSFALETMER